MEAGALGYDVKNPAIQRLLVKGPGDLPAVRDGGKVFVMGEDMKSRVIPYADARGYKVYRPTERLEDKALKEDNIRNINQIMDEGYIILDIGPSRRNTNYPLATKQAYKDELAEIVKRGYSKYFWDPR